jgi:hypothetical protein
MPCVSTSPVLQPAILLDFVRRLENRTSPERGRQVAAVLASLRIEPHFQRCLFPRIMNIIVDLPQRSARKRLVFSAHYDAVGGCPGANDNASSVAVLLGLCAQFKDRDPPLPLRLIFFDREEAWFRTPFIRLGLLGSSCYVLRNRLRDVEAVFNLEYTGDGDALALWPVKKRVEPLPLLQKIESAARALDLDTRTALFPWLLLSGDHLPFRLRGLAQSVTISLLPSEQIPALEEMIAELSVFKLLAGRRPKVPSILARVHSAQDTSASVREESLQTALKLLLEIIRQYSSGG